MRCFFLENYGMYEDMCKQAFACIRKLPGIVIPRFGSLSQQAKAVVELLNRSHLQLQLPVLEKQSQPKILITGLLSDAEILSCCYLLQHMINREASKEKNVAVIRSAREFEDTLESAVYLVVILSPGLFEDTNFLSILHLAGDLQVLSVVTENGFIATDTVFSQTSLEDPSSLHGQDLAQARRLCNVPAVHITARGSERNLESQVLSLCSKLVVSEETFGDSFDCVEVVNILPVTVGVASPLISNPKVAET
jgi:hypothetical protein